MLIYAVLCLVKVSNVTKWLIFQNPVTFNARCISELAAQTGLYGIRSVKLTRKPA